MPKNYSTVAALSLLLSLLVLLPLADFGRVFQVSEAREGVVVLEILQSGEYILPLRHDRIVPSKPMLFHWLGVSFAKIFGYYDVFVLRLPSVLAASACVLAVSLLAFSTGLTLSWLIAAGVLLSTYAFLHLAYDARVDMVCCFFMTAAICYWLYRASEIYQQGLGLQRLSFGTYALTAALCGFAILAKGPIGIILPGLVITLVSFYFWRMRGVLSLLNPAWLIALVVSLPWYFLAAASGKESFVSRQILFENYTRFFGGEGISRKPFWFYLTNFWSQLAPWSIIAGIFLLCFLWSRFEPSRRRWFNNYFLPKQGSRGYFVFTASWLWLLAELIFLSLSSGKRRGYLLVITPALALFVSQFLSVYFSKLSSELRSGMSVWYAKRSFFRISITTWSIIFSSCLLFLLMLYVEPLSSVVFSWIPLSKAGVVTWHSFEQVLARGGLVLAIFFALSASLSFILFIKAWKRANYLLYGFGLFFLLQLVFGVIVNTGLAAKGETHTYEDFAQAVMAKIPQGETLTFIKPLRDESFDAFFFYYREPSRIIQPSEPFLGSGYFIARTRWLYAMPAPSWIGEVNAILTGGRKIDEPSEKLVLFKIGEQGDASRLIVK